MSLMWLSASEIDRREQLREGQRTGQSGGARRCERDRRKLERAALPGVDVSVDADHGADDDGSRDGPVHVQVAKQQPLEMPLLDGDALGGRLRVAGPFAT